MVSVLPNDCTDWSLTTSCEDILRKYQAEQLYEQHKMTRLAIFRDTISKSFEDQVLASRGYENKQRLLVIFHDP